MRFSNNKKIASAAMFGMLVSFLSLLCGCASLNGKNYSSLGSFNFSRNDFERAVEYFTKAVDADSERTDDLAMLGWSQFKLGNYDRAISIFQTLSEMDPRSIDPYTGKGWCEFKKGNYDQAILHFAEALNLKPSSSDAYAGIGWCSFRKGALPVAERFFKAADAVAMKYKRGVSLKTEPEAHRGLGHLKTSEGNFAEALRHFQIATKLRPDWNDARLKWGDSLFALGKYQDAILLYRHSLNYSKSAETYDKIGWAYLYLGDKGPSLDYKPLNYKYARAYFNKSLAIDPTYASSLSGLAELEKR